MIFKTYETELDGISNKLGFSKRSFADWHIQVKKSFNEAGKGMKGFFSALSTAFSAKNYDKDFKRIKSSGEIVTKDNINSYISELSLDDANNMAKQIANIDKAKDSWQDYFEVLEKDKHGDIIKFIKNTDNLSKITGDDLVKANEAARQSALAHNAALQQQTLGAKAAALGITALNVAASIGIGLLINLGISLLQAGWEKLQEAFKSTDEKIKDLSQDLNASLQNIQSISKEFQNLKSSADEIIPRFAELSNGVDNFGENISLTDEEYQEFLDLNNKIADMFPELNVGLDSNGNAMLALSGDADTLTESLYALLEVQRQTTNQKIAESFGDTFDKTKDLADLYKKKKEETENNSLFVRNTRVIIDNPDLWENRIIAESGQEMSYLEYAIEKLEFLFSLKDKKDQFNDLKNKYTVKLYQDGELVKESINWESLFEDKAIQNTLNDVINGYDKEIKDLETTIEYKWKSLSSSISVVVETNPLYESLDGELKNMAKVISAGVDPSEFESSEKLEQYIQNNKLSPLNHIPIDAQEIISQIPSLQEQLKAGNISENEFLTQTTEAFNSLYESMDKDTAKNFSDTFVKGYNAMGIEGDGFNEVVQNLMSSWTDFTKAVTEATKTPKTFIDSLSEVESLSNGLNKLAAIYQDIKDGERFDWSSILNNEDFAAQFE